MTGEQVQLVNLVIQVVISVAMVATFWVYHRQLKAMRDGAKGQNTLALVNFLQSPEIRASRTIVRQSLRNKPYAEWSPEERRAADMVCANYDVTSVLVLQEKLVPARPILRNWGPSIRDCFEILHPHILEMQKSSNSGPEYWDDLGQLYEAARTNGVAGR